MQNQLININPDLTMSSLEIVKVINAIRKSEGNDTALQHSDFLKKVPDVLGAKQCGKFLLHRVKQGLNNSEIKIPYYKFPKRESMLMAMSYSYSVQAAVYDAYAELEAKQTQPKALTNRELALMVIAEADRADKAEARIEKLVHSNNSYTTSMIAKEAGFKSAQELNQALLADGIVYRQRGVYLLKAKYSGKGYQEIKQKELDNGKIIYNATWTDCGREWLLDYCERL